MGGMGAQQAGANFGGFDFRQQGAQRHQQRTTKQEDLDITKTLFIVKILNGKLSIFY